jgi:hypothetical protein
VRVTGEPVGNGYAVEVEDRGLGMGTESLAEANRRIEQSEALDLFDSDRLGLFVVSRLAARHGIKVHLRTSPYGGTTAVILLPTALLHGGAAERSPRAAVGDGERAVQREYARVPTAAQHQESVSGPADRPALASSPRASAELANDTPPPGVTTLRLHRPPEDTEGPEESDDLPRRVRQANLAPQLREQPTADREQAPAAPRDEHRTPEVVRDRMAAYREGWTRGGGRHPGRGATPGPATGSDSSEGDPA